MEAEKMPEQDPEKEEAAWSVLHEALRFPRMSPQGNLALRKLRIAAMFVCVFWLSEVCKMPDDALPLVIKELLKSETTAKIFLMNILYIKSCFYFYLLYSFLIYFFNLLIFLSFVNCSLNPWPCHPAWRSVGYSVSRKISLFGTLEIKPNRPVEAEARKGLVQRVFDLSQPSHAELLKSFFNNQRYLLIINHIMPFFIFFIFAILSLKDLVVNYNIWWPAVRFVIFLNG
jgi:hypothetical protein